MIKVELSTNPANAMLEARALLVGVRNGYNRALHNANKRAATLAKTQGRKEAIKRYAITASKFRANENVTVNSSLTGQQSRMEVLFKGPKLSLLEFKGASPQTDTRYSRLRRVLIGTPDGKGKWALVHPSIPARAHVLNGGGGNFDNAFTLQMHSGHKGIFAQFHPEHASRKTKFGGTAIHELVALSTPEMVGHDEVLKNMAQPVSDRFVERLQHETERLLNGFGA